MSEVFSPQNWQLLSEYLDGQCSTKDRQMVEQMLHSSNTWKLNYQALVETRALIQYAPKRKAPRSFLLTQAQADTLRKPRPSIFSFRFVSMLSTGLAVAVFLFGFFVSSTPVTRPAMQAAPMQEKVSQTDVVDPTPAAPIIIWGPPGTIPDGYGNFVNGSGGGGGYGGGAPQGVGGGGGDGGVQSFSVAAPTDSSEISPDAASELTTETTPEAPVEGAPETSREIAPEFTPEGVTEAAPEISSDVITETAPPAPALGVMMATETPVEAVSAPEMTAEETIAPTPEMIPALPESTLAPSAMPTPTLIPEVSNDQAERLTGTEPSGSGPILGVQSDEVPAATEPVQAPLETETSEPDKNPFWYVSGILLGIGILTGLAALISSRKKNK